MTAAGIRSLAISLPLARAVPHVDDAVFIDGKHAAVPIVKTDWETNEDRVKKTEGAVPKWFKKGTCAANDLTWKGSSPNPCKFCTYAGVALHEG